MELERGGWSGDGDFTRRLIDALRQVSAVVWVRVEDAPASQSGADYQFLSNELHVGFATLARWETGRRWGIPWPRRVQQPVMTLADLSDRLAEDPDVGAPDYADEGLLQYLRSERMVAACQTRGFKLVELVRVYALMPTPRG